MVWNIYNLATEILVNDMRKTLIGLVLTISSLAALAQADVVSAYNLNKEGKYAKAAEFIDRALTNEKAVAKEKTWRYRGDIYMNIALDSALSVEFPDALTKSFESYLKARELDKRGSYADQIKMGLTRAMNKSMNDGIGKYNAKDYGGAAMNFALSNRVSQEAFDSTFTLALYNTALSYEKAGDLDNAVKYYYECAEIKYQVPEVYLLIANLYSNAEQEDKALEVLQKARMEYPKDKNLILEELNIYLRNKEYEKAKSNLAMAIEADPSNEVLFFSQGAVNDELGNKEEAEAAYLKAIEIKPEYADARYNLGALYYNIGADLINEANEIPPREQKRYEAKMEEAKGYFTKAEPHFVKALEVNPDDMNVMTSLKNIYARTGEDDKLMEMTKRMQGK